MNRIAGRAAITLVIAALLVAGLLFFLGEYFIRGESWALFPGSPHVYTGGNIGCGVVTDREGTLLLDMRGERTYGESEAVRKATLHWLGDRNGFIHAPALSHYAEALAGYDPVNGLYSYGNTGGKAVLTLSSRVEAAALKAMGKHKGTIAVYNYETGELLCAISTPTFDPDAPPDIEGDTTGEYEGVYLNRFTQSVYTPGSIFKIVTLAAALEEIPDIADQQFTCKKSLILDGGKITCERRHGKQTLQEAFTNSCNCAFAQITLQLGGENLERYAKQFGVLEPLEFDGITTGRGNLEAAGAGRDQIAWSGIGQHKDQVNPARYLTFLGTIARGGQGIEPYLVKKISVGGRTTYQASPVEGERILSQATAEILREYLRNNVKKKYGADNFPGLTVCDKTGTAEVGGGRKPNAMFTGFVADEEYPLAFFVAVENGGYGSKVCIPILSQVLDACKALLDEAA